MALIVSIETSTTACSVALHQEGKLISEMGLFLEKSHSNYLTLMIEKTVEYAGYSLNEIDAFAVSKGPGSYTGLRIGVSTAKGLCFALDKPLIAINTLEAMALQISPFFDEKHLFCSLIDARRMEVYCAIFNKKMETISPTQAKIIDETSFKEELSKNKIVFLGNGAEKCKEVIKSENIIYLDNIHPNAKEIGFLAIEKHKNKQWEDVAYFEPFYLKDFVGK
jgi:tRNA threonylcarbamoyladenosine biosynthesis protein TsaB